MAVYFIQEENERGRIKIGVADDVPRRLAELQTGSPSALKIMLVLDDENHFSLEKAFHDEFSDYRIHGEWFDYSECLAGFLASPDETLARLRKQTKKKMEPRDLFKPMSTWNAVEYITTVALGAKNAGHNVIVRHAKVTGQAGILVFLPGFELTDGNLKLVQEEPETA